MSYSSPYFSKESNSYIMSQFNHNAISAAEAAVLRPADATGGGELIPENPQQESPITFRMHQTMLRAMQSYATAAITALQKDGDSSIVTSFAINFSEYAKTLGEYMERALADHVTMREQHRAIEENFRKIIETQNSVLANRRTIGAWDMAHQEDMTQEIDELQDKLKDIEEKLGVWFEKPGASLPELEAELDQKIISKKAKETRQLCAKMAVQSNSCL